MEFNDSKKFIEMLQHARAFVEMGLSIVSRQLKCQVNDN